MAPLLLLLLSPSLVHTPHIFLTNPVHLSCSTWGVATEESLSKNVKTRTVVRGFLLMAVSVDSRTKILTVLSLSERRNIWTLWRPSGVDRWTPLYNLYNPQPCNIESGAKQNSINVAVVGTGRKRRG